MKHQLLLASILGFTIHAKSQTIVETDLPNVGNVVVEYIDNTNTNLYSVSAPGTGQSWNFASQFSIDDTSGVNCMSPSNIPWNASTSFPNSEFGNYDLVDSVAGFYSSNGTGLYLDGYFALNSGFPGLTSFPFVNSRLMVPVPFSMNSMRNHSSYMQIEAPVEVSPNVFINVRNRSYTIQNFTADASGSLVTPAGTFPSALRVKEFSYVVDSSWVDLAGNGNWTLSDASGPKDTTIYYRWFANGLPAYRMQLEVNPINNQVIGASFFDNDFVLNTKRLEGSQLQLFPSPTTGLVTLKNVNNQQLTVINLVGQSVLTKIITNDTESVDLSNFPAGTYFFKLTEQSGNSSVKKIVKQ